MSKPGAKIFDVDKVIPLIEARWPAMSKKQVYLAATEQFFDQVNDAIRQKQHFTLETNFRDYQLAEIVAGFKRNGYTTNMVYLTLENIEQSISRVNERVLDGGHFVDVKNIQQNYDQGLQYLERFADQFDNLRIYDASKGPGELISLFKVKQQHLVYLNADLPARVEQTVSNIANRYQNNSRSQDNDEEQEWDQGLGR